METIPLSSKLIDITGLRFQTTIDCAYCVTVTVENEKHFLVECPLYSDLRYNECTKHIENFNLLSTDQKLYSIMSCHDIQRYVCKYLYKFYMRRKLFLR